MTSETPSNARLRSSVRVLVARLRQARAAANARDAVIDAALARAMKRENDDETKALKRHARAARQEAPLPPRWPKATDRRDELETR